jgi:hypothetical protein
VQPATPTPARRPPAPVPPKPVPRVVLRLRPAAPRAAPPETVVPVPARHAPAVEWLLTSRPAQRPAAQDATAAQPLAPPPTPVAASEALPRMGDARPGGTVTAAPDAPRREFAPTTPSVPPLQPARSAPCRAAGPGRRAVRLAVRVVRVCKFRDARAWLVGRAVACAAHRCADRRAPAALRPRSPQGKTRKPAPAAPTASAARWPDLPPKAVHPRKRWLEALRALARLERLEREQRGL